MELWQVREGSTCTTPLMACCMKRMAMSMPNSSPENLVNLVIYSHIPARHTVFGEAGQLPALTIQWVRSAETAPTVLEALTRAWDQAALNAYMLWFMEACSECTNASDCQCLLWHVVSW